MATRRIDEQQHGDDDNEQQHGDNDNEQQHGDDDNEHKGDDEEEHQGEEVENKQKRSEAAKNWALWVIETQTSSI